MTIWKTIRAWLIHFFTPHCPDCEAVPPCETCEVLKLELAHAHDLIKTLTAPKEPVEPPTVKENFEPIRPRGIMPSRVKRELEENDKAMAQAKARAEKNLEKPVEEISLKDLEDELQEVKAARDAKIN